MFFQAFGRSQAAASTEHSPAKAWPLLLAGVAGAFLIAGLPARAAAEEDPVRAAISKTLASNRVNVDASRFEFQYAFQLRARQDVTVVMSGYGSSDVILCNHETGKGRFTVWKGSTRQGMDILGNHCLVFYHVDGFDLNTQGEIPDWSGIIFVRPAAR